VPRALRKALRISIALSNALRDFLAISWAFDTNAATTRESASFA